MIYVSEVTHGDHDHDDEHHEEDHGEEIEADAQPAAA